MVQNKLTHWAVDVADKNIGLNKVQWSSLSKAVKAEPKDHSCFTVKGLDPYKILIRPMSLFLVQLFA